MDWLTCCHPAVDMY